MFLIKPQLVIFDWDNTLVHSWPKLHNSVAYTMEKLGMEPWNMAKVQSTMHRSSREFFPEVFKERWEEARAVFYEHYSNNHTSSILVLDNAERTLITLKEHDIKMAVISNKTGQYLRAEVEKLGWNRYFDSVLGAYDLDEDKPSPKPVYHTLQTLGLEAGNTNWFVGDTIVDIECAVNSGCSPILFGPQIEEAPHPKDKSLPYWHAEDHLELGVLITKAPNS